MKTGRRAFLKFLASALAGVAADPLSNCIQTTKHFADKRLGFGFQIPPSWHLKAFSSFNELRGKQLLAEPFREDEALMDELSEGLMATLSKYPISDDSSQVFSPSITFFMSDDSELENYDSLIDLASDAITGFSTVLTDYTCTSAPKVTCNEHFKAVRAKSKFLFECKGMKPTVIDDEVLVVHYNQRLYTVHLYDSPYTGDESQSEFQLFKSSLHLA